MDSVASKNLTAPSMQVFQIPSQFVAERVGLVRWLSLLLITWGAVATSFAGLTRSHIHLYVLRFLLGDSSLHASQQLLTLCCCFEWAIHSAP